MLSIKNNDSYALRQLAWINHEQGNWNVAGQFAYQAFESNKESIYHLNQVCRILSLNTLEWFNKADRVFKQALKISNNSPDVLKQYEKYKLAKEGLSNFPGIKRDKFIPEKLFKYLRPGLSFYKVFYKKGSKDYAEVIEMYISGMQGSWDSSSEMLNEAISEIDIKQNNILHSKYLCNVGRILFLTWREAEEIIDDTKSIENLFLKSINLNNQNAFSHCWLGTYYKDVLKNYKLAEEYYSKAFALSTKSDWKFEKTHPLFANNYGLLLLDRYKLDKNLKDLEKAKEHFKVAIANNNDYDYNFIWAEINYAECTQIFPLNVKQ
jgi:tetratricopeptide (TPR) repeat protein